MGSPSQTNIWAVVDAHAVRRIARDAGDMTLVLSSAPLGTGPDGTVALLVVGPLKGVTTTE